MDLQLTTVYALVDPRTKDIRYIGKANNPASRLRRHISDAKTRSYHSAAWIRSLVSKGLRPYLEVIAEVPITEWEFWEVYYINYFRSVGFDLTNLAIGGGKGNAGKKASAETRKKMSLAHSGAKNYWYQVTGPSHPCYGRKDSEELKEQKRKAKLGALNPAFGRPSPNRGQRLSGGQREQLLTRIRKNNKSGVVGVSWNEETQKWMAHARCGDTRHYLGMYLTVAAAEQAISAKKAAKNASNNHE